MVEILHRRLQSPGGLPDSCPPQSRALAEPPALSSPDRGRPSPRSGLRGPPGSLTNLTGGRSKRDLCGVSSGRQAAGFPTSRTPPWPRWPTEAPTRPPDLTISKERVGEVEAADDAGEGVVGGAGLDAALHWGHLHVMGTGLLSQLRVGLLQLDGQRPPGRHLPHTPPAPPLPGAPQPAPSPPVQIIPAGATAVRTHQAGGRGQGAARRGSPAPAHLAGGISSPLLARHSALADAPEGLAQRLLEGLHPGQRPLHGQRVVGVKRAPAGRQTSAGPHGTVPERPPCPRWPHGPGTSGPATLPRRPAAGGLKLASGTPREDRAARGGGGSQVTLASPCQVSEGETRGPDPACLPRLRAHPPHTWPAPGSCADSRRGQSRDWCQRPRGSTPRGA